MNIKAIREKKGLKQTDIAEKLNINQSAVAAWETGKALPRAETLIALADILECSIDELLGRKKGA